MLSYLFCYYNKLESEKERSLFHYDFSSSSFVLFIVCGNAVSIIIFCSFLLKTFFIFIFCHSSAINAPYAIQCDTLNFTHYGLWNVTLEKCWRGNKFPRAPHIRSFCWCFSTINRVFAFRYVFLWKLILASASNRFELSILPKLFP